MGSSRNIRITLNKRAETAAAAIVHNMMMRSKPLEFLLVEFRSMAFSEVTAAIIGRKEETTRRQKVREMTDRIGDDAPRTEFLHICIFTQSRNVSSPQSWQNGKTIPKEEWR